MWFSGKHTLREDLYAGSLLVNVFMMRTSVGEWSRRIRQREGLSCNTIPPRVLELGCPGLKQGIQLHLEVWPLRDAWPWMKWLSSAYKGNSWRATQLTVLSYQHSQQLMEWTCLCPKTEIWKAQHTFTIAGETPQVKWSLHYHQEWMNPMC